MGSEDARTFRRLKNAGLLWAGAASSYFIAAASMIYLTSNGRDIATVWPANAILVALLLAQSKPRWLPVLGGGFAGNLAANLVTRGTLVGPFLYGVANLIEVVLAAGLFHPICQRASILESPAKVVRFILIAGLLAPLASAMLGGVTALSIYGEPLQRSVLTWLTADSLGLLVFTPFFFAVLKGDYATCFRERSWLRRGEIVALLILLGLVSGYVFYSSPRPLLFMVFPPLMLITFRVGRLGTKAGVMLVAVIGGVATMRGYGPITLLSSDPASQAQIFQAFLAATLLTCLPAAAEVTAKTKLTAIWRSMINA